jgi:hypothetical protein
MNPPTPVRTEAVLMQKSISGSPLRYVPFLTALALVCFALPPAGRAVDPPPDGAFPNQNTAKDDNALASLTTGTASTAIDADTICNMMMLGNTPYGCQALEGNTTGLHNTAIGLRALAENAMGNNNTAIGFRVLVDNAAGNNNTAMGVSALSCNTGSDNIALGARAGVYHMAGDNNIYIGNQGKMAPEDGQIRIGMSGVHTGTYIAGVRDAAVSGSPVVIGMGGKLGVTMSSAQFKEAIKPMDEASEAILGLKPVTFCYKQEFDPDKIPQFGLIAEEVEKVNPDLVARDKEGKVNTVRYEAVNAMLLNEFLKEHRKVEAQERNGQKQQSTITALKAVVAQQQKQIDALTATVQKVSDQLVLSKPAQQLVTNP